MRQKSRDTRKNTSDVKTAQKNTHHLIMCCPVYLDFFFLVFLEAVPKENTVCWSLVQIKIFYLDDYSPWNFMWVFRVPRGSFMILWTPWHFVFPISKSNNSPWRTLWSMTEYLETTINFAASHCSWRRMNPHSISDQVFFLLLLPPGQSNLLKNYDELCSKRFLAATDAKTHTDAD